MSVSMNFFGTRIFLVDLSLVVTQSGRKLDFFVLISFLFQRPKVLTHWVDPKQKTISRGESNQGGESDVGFLTALGGAVVQSLITFSKSSLQKGIVHKLQSYPYFTS